MKTFNAVQSLVNDKAIMAAHDISAGGLVTTLLEMTFANVDGGIAMSTEGLRLDGRNRSRQDSVCREPALVIQVADAKTAKVESILEKPELASAP